jgi:predicted nucleic acid-binding protein
MPLLIDTGILLRIANRDDPLHGDVRAALKTLKGRGEQTVTALQNIAEFWNVCKRPASARGGLGLKFDQAERRLRLVERIVEVLDEPEDLYARWRQIVLTYQVLGVRVHDARLVATMQSFSITTILTLNSADFARYQGIHALIPRQLLLSG